MIRRRVLPAAIGLLIVLALAVLRLADPYPVQLARESAFDVLQQIRPRPHSDAPVRVIDIDEASLAAIGQWPWPRSILATLTQRLGELGAAAIGYDVLFPEPDRLSPSRLEQSPLTWAGLYKGPPLADYDAEFAAALASTPSILGFSIAARSATMPTGPKTGFAVTGAANPQGSIARIPGAVLPLKILADAAPGLGGLSLENADTATIVRKVPLVWSDGKNLYPSLALESLRMAMGIPTVVVVGDAGGQGFVESVRLGSLIIPTTAEGDLTLYYSRPDPQLYISAKDILAPDYHDLAPLVQGEIVLIGTSASGLLDIHTTALDQTVPGVSIHAEAISQILAGASLLRSDWVSGLEIAAFLIIGVLVVFIMLWAGPLAAMLIGAGLLVAMLGAVWIAFTQYGLLIDPSFPLYGTFILYSVMAFLRFALTDADRRRLRHAFVSYVDPALLGQIERSGDKLKLGGDVRDLTVMFCDIRNFTTISENLDPEALLAMLNTLFGALGAEVTGQFGTIDKFIGDSLMAFWNAPVDVAEHPLRACHAALGMRARMRALNASDAFGRKAAGLEPGDIAIGTGMSTGPAFVGNMGLETRFDYSCIGDTVNVASRVEGACKTVGYDIVIVEETRSRAAALATLEAGSLYLKGKSARERIHVLVGDEAVATSPSFLALRDAHEAAIAALTSGRPADAEITTCRVAAAAVDPNLARFYDLLAERADDFAVTDETQIIPPTTVELIGSTGA